MLPAREDRGIVVFKVLPSISYPTRMTASFALIAIGLILQMAMVEIFPGVIAIFLGNLLLLVSGYDNRVDFDRWRPAASWERAGVEKLEELTRLHRQIKRWDRSALDVTNPIGLLLFLIVVAMLAFAVFAARGLGRMLAIDGLVLLVPHWLTGIRRILTQPRLMIKVDTIDRLLHDLGPRLDRHRVDLMMLLDGKETKIPVDLKFKVDIQEHDPDFLGLYGQVVLNEVQGRSYPYFYVVLVAKKGFGLRPAYDRYDAPAGITREFKVQRDVEVFVIRQHTTKTSGYHTKPGVAARILAEGLRLAEKVAGGVRAG